ncbi:MAG: hypothetical protein M3Y71_06910 [Actinomycetota bacterium]|nr:hypothetical protein [Actinomycetota bacterium]
MSLPFRSRVEHRTHPLLERLNRAPRVVVALAVAALLVAGFLVPHVGWIATALVVVFVGFLVWSTWPRCTLPERLLRMAVLAIAAALTIVQAFPRG